MLKPFFVPNFERKIFSGFKASIALNAGGLVDVDPADTTAIAGQVGYTCMINGSLKLATPAALPANNAATQVYTRELGFAVANVNATGPLLIERILELASSYLTIPEGLQLAVLIPAPGDIIATSEYVGFLGGTDHGTGWIDVTSTGNYNAACEVYQGRYRLAQGGNPVRARYLGNTQSNGVQIGLFQVA